MCNPDLGENMKNWSCSVENKEKQGQKLKVRNKQVEDQIATRIHTGVGGYSKQSGTFSYGVIMLAETYQKFL